MSDPLIAPPNNHVIAVEVPKDKEPKLNKKRRIPQRVKDGKLTEQQKWRVYKTYIEPSITLKDESSHENEIVRQIKKVFGIDTSSEFNNMKASETFGNYNPMLENNLRNEQARIKELEKQRRIPRSAIKSSHRLGATLVTPPRDKSTYMMPPRADTLFGKDLKDDPVEWSPFIGYEPPSTKEIGTSTLSSRTKKDGTPDYRTKEGKELQRRQLFAGFGDDEVTFMGAKKDK